MDHLEIHPLADCSHDNEEMIAAIWAEQEGAADRKKKTFQQWAPGNYDLEDDYNQTQFLTGGYDRDYSGISNDWRMK